MKKSETERLIKIGKKVGQVGGVEYWECPDCHHIVSGPGYPKLHTCRAVKIINNKS